MKKYKYEAIDPKGKAVEGIIPSDTFEEVVFKLLQSNLYPTRVEELTGGALIAHGRLEKLKEVKRRLEPQPSQTTRPSPVATKSGNRMPKLLLLAIIALWLAMVAAYLAL